jgi:type II secretory pathway pseudopilin PulG
MRRLSARCPLPSSRRRPRRSLTIGTSPTARGKLAFTVIELLLVVIVMGILAAVAAPAFLDSLLFYRVESAARRVKADLELARRTARLTSASQSVSFSGTSYAMSAGVVDLDKPLGAYAVDLARAPYEIASLTADFGGSPTVSFDGYGTPSSGGTVVLGAPNHECVVTLDGDSGDAAISRNHARSRSPE